jgi:hypothetical protein
MLQPSQCKDYQDFQQALERLHKTTAATDLQGEVIENYFQKVQQVFKNQIASLSLEDIPGDYGSRWQSIQTEIYKQMRLLETDIMLWRASRSSATSFERGSRLRDRIHILMQYCEVISH